MFYIEKTLKLQLGIELKSLSFHFISRYRVDFVNKITEVEVSSTDSKASFEAKGGACSFVSFIELRDAPSFHECAVTWIWDKLTSSEHNVFYGLKVIKDERSGV